MRQNCLSLHRRNQNITTAFMIKKQCQSLPHSNGSRAYGCAEKGICGDPCFLLDLYRGLM